MAAAATATGLRVRAAALSVTASPLLRPGRARRTRRRRRPCQGGLEEAEAPGGGRGCCCRRHRRPLGRRLGRPLPPPRPASGGEPPPPTTTTAPVPAERDFIFRAPITISKPGELHEEYKSQLRKLRGDRVQEERPAEDCIHKLIVEESDAGRKKTEDLESLTVKMTQEHFPERLSDSENEEPFHGKSAHRSAFVSKGNSYSVALLAGNLTAKVERSQSCNDTLRERSKSRQRAASVRAKVPDDPFADLEETLPSFPLIFFRRPRVPEETRRLFQVFRW